MIFETFEHTIIGFIFGSFNNKRFPFDWKNPIGYVVAIAYEYMGGVCTFFVAMAILKYAIVVYFFLFSMIDDIKCDLESINRNAKKKKTRMEVVKQFSEMIQFHWKVMELSTFFLE